MRKFLIPLATAITALLSNEDVAYTSGQTLDDSQSVFNAVEEETARHLGAVIPESFTSLVLAKTSQNVQMASHRSHRSHASHRSHRSGR